MKVWQPGGHLVRDRSAKVEDWSWAQTKRRLSTLYRLAKPYKLRTALAILIRGRVWSLLGSSCGCACKRCRGARQREAFSSG